MVDQFREYLQYIKTDNNPFTYVMLSPNLDAMGHRWVAALANFNISLEYQKGSDKDSVKELMQQAKAGGEASHAEADNPWVVQEDEQLDNEVILQAKSMIARKVVFKNIADKHWIRVQKDDLVLHHVQEWLTQPKGDKQTLSGYLNRRVLDTD